MTSFSYYWVWVFVGVVWGIEAALASVAHRRGREAPWLPKITFEPPRFADSRLNKIEALLLVIFIPLGMLLVILGVVLTIGFDVSEDLSYALLFVGIACMVPRGIFVAACLAYAELADAPAVPEAN